MATDIHAFLEFEPLAGHIGSFSDGEIFISRDYPLFAALAGVRAEQGQQPLFPPRGLPKDVSDGVHRFFFQPVINDAGTPSDFSNDFDETREWVPRSTADEYAARGYAIYDGGDDGPREFISYPDWYAASWLTLNEIQAALDHVRLDLTKKPRPEFQAVLAAMQVLDQHEAGVRLVFWFDN